MIHEFLTHLTDGLTDQDVGFIVLILVVVTVMFSWLKE